MSTKEKKLSWAGIPVPNTLEPSKRIQHSSAFGPELPIQVGHSRRNVDAVNFFDLPWPPVAHHMITSWWHGFFCWAKFKFGKPWALTRILDARVWVPSRMGVPHADVAIICFKRPQSEDDLRHCGSVKRTCDSTCSVSKTSCLEMALKHIIYIYNTRKWTSPVFKWAGSGFEGPPVKLQGSVSNFSASFPMSRTPPQWHRPWRWTWRCGEPLHRMQTDKNLERIYHQKHGRMTQELPR